MEELTHVIFWWRSAAVFLLEKTTDRHCIVSTWSDYSGTVESLRVHWLFCAENGVWSRAAREGFFLAMHWRQIS